MANPQPIKHLDVKTYTTNGVGVIIQIDYDNAQISLVEAEKGSMPIKYRGKQWVFTNRTLEYMGGWQNIFDAMKFAVSAAEADLRKHVQRKEKEERNKF